MAHRVTAPAVQVQVGNRIHILHRGAVLPEGVPGEVVERLAGLGMVAKAAEPKPEAKPAAKQASSKK